ncbi:hypothetical protein ID866_5155 [Astraeus odoratus]|jgi:hypothetical protein
MEAS